jgi:hypothetical protein
MSSNRQSPGRGDRGIAHGESHGRRMRAGVGSPVRGGIDGRVPMRGDFMSPLAGLGRFGTPNCPHGSRRGLRLYRPWRALQNAVEPTEPRQGRQRNSPWRKPWERLGSKNITSPGRGGITCQRRFNQTQIAGRIRRRAFSAKPRPPPEMSFCDGVAPGLLCNSEPMRHLIG